MQWDTTDTEIKIPSTENRTLSKIPYFKPGAAQNIALRVCPTARKSVFLTCAFSVLSTSFFVLFFVFVFISSSILE